MKYTKISKKIVKVVLSIMYIFIILFVLGLAGLFLWLDMSLNIPMISMLWLVLLPAFGLVINWLIGHFFDDEYYNTGMVYEGMSVYDVVKTPKYYRRRMFMCFVEVDLFLLLLFRFLVYTLFPFGVIYAILGIIGSIIGAVIYFIVGMSSYEQSDLKKQDKVKKKNKLAKSKTTEKSPKKKLHKFNFEKFPELLEKYEEFKVLNNKKYADDNVIEEYDKCLVKLASAVYDIFNEIKPNLILKKTGKVVEWEKVINKPFEELSYMEKTILVRLLDKHYKYVLPKEYYNN